MFSLLVLSLVLSAPSSAAQAAVASGDSLAPESALQLLVRPGVPLTDGGPQATSFDAMEIQPDGDTCFKIRAYVFSTGRVPKLLRETTCGPKRGALKSIDGAKPKLMLLDATGDTATGEFLPR